MSVPAPVAARFPARRVLAEVNGAAYQTRLATYSGRTYLGIRQALLRSLGVSAGDVVHVVLREPPPDPAAEPGPTGPVPELDTALADDAVLASAYAALPTEHREEYRRWVGAGGTPEDRGARVTRLRHRLVPDGSR